MLSLEGFEPEQNISTVSACLTQLWQITTSNHCLVPVKEYGATDKLWATIYSVDIKPAIIFDFDYE